jgi:transposase-like protein
MRKRRRFTPEFKAQVVLDILTGRQSPAEACRRHALSPTLLSLWKAQFLQRASTLFQPDEQRDGDQARIAELERMLGRATLQVEVLKKASTLLASGSIGGGPRSSGFGAATPAGSSARRWVSTAAASTMSPGRTRTGRRVRP